MRRALWPLTAMAVVLTGVIIHGSRSASSPPRPPIAAAVSKTPPPFDPRPMELRKLGRFDEAEQLLRAEIASSREPERGQLRQRLLGVLEDAGRIHRFFTEARSFAADYPREPAGSLYLARALLFNAAAGAPHRSALLAEARSAMARADAVGWTPFYERGALAIVHMQLDFLSGNYPRADAEAQQALAMGATPGEATDLSMLRFDLAVRRGDRKAAQRYLADFANQVRSWNRQQVYYQLYPCREAVLLFRLAFLGVPYTRADLDRPVALYEDLEKSGLRERFGLQIARTFLYGYADLMKQGRLSDQLSALQLAIRTYPPPHRPTCFYGESVYLPLVRAALRLQMGEVCRRMGRLREARACYLEALAMRPHDRLIEARLGALSRERTPGRFSSTHQMDHAGKRPSSRGDGKAST